MEDSEYCDDVIQLEPGDRVCLFSDGLIEQFGDANRGQFGMPRFVELLGRLRREPPEQTVTKTLAALTEWAGGPVLTDDASLVLVDWHGPGARG